MFLISLVVQKEIMFCGDTAQTIAKGVEFRFSDLKFIFHHAKSIPLNKFSILKQEPLFKTLNVKKYYNEIMINIIKL